MDWSWVNHCENYQQPSTSMAWLYAEIPSANLKRYEYNPSGTSYCSILIIWLKSYGPKDMVAYTI